MKKFLIKSSLFTLGFIVVLVLSVFLPTTPRASKSLLFAGQRKDKLLLQTETSRMIFVGGSNLSFGLDSKFIEEHLGLRVINTAVHANLGIKYMIENTIQYVKEGDVVVLAAEYSHFYRNYDSVSEELLRTILDVDASKYELLSATQLVSLIPLLPKYALSKLKFTEYIGVTESDVYSVNSFNDYGDVDAHWQFKRRQFAPSGQISGELNDDVFRNLVIAQQQISRKGAILLVTFPAFQDISYENNIEQIERVSVAYKKYNFNVLGYPERYKIPNEMMFNSPYHLNRKGVEHRTQLFIEDYLRWLTDKS
jgi:hypothetical protein